MSSTRNAFIAWTAPLAAALALAGCGDGSNPEEASTAGGPNPQPAFYVTANDVTGLKDRACAAGEKFAQSQGAGEAVMVLDFGAARVKHGTHGVALEEGTFFSNEEVAEAIEQAGHCYSEHHKRGTVRIVFAVSNAFLSRPGPAYERFDEGLAREAGEQQARTVAGLHLGRGQIATVGGDIEPGYDVFGSPDVSIALVEGADSGSKEPYYDIGTAPCEGKKCVNGWTPKDICQVAAGPGREVLPEVYTEKPEDQPAQWAAIQKTCKIKSFAGVSASPADGSFSAQESWQELRKKTAARVEPVIVVFPEE